MQNLATLTKGNLVGIIKGYQGYLNQMVERYPNDARLKVVKAQFDKVLAAQNF